MSGTTIAIIDYGMGNLRSVAKAVEAAGGTVRLVTHPEEIDGAARARAARRRGVG
jgi:glutamine amidotransferase